MFKKFIQTKDSFEIKVLKIFDQIFETSQKDKYNSIFKQLYYTIDLPKVICNEIYEYCEQPFEFKIKFENNEMIIDNEFLCFYINFSYSTWPQSITLKLKNQTEPYFYVDFNNDPPIWNKYLVYANLISAYIKTYSQKSTNVLCKNDYDYSRIYNKDLKKMNPSFQESIFSPKTIDDYDMFIEYGLYFRWTIFILKSDFINDLFFVAFDVIQKLLEECEAFWLRSDKIDFNKVLME